MWNTHDASMRMFWTTTEESRGDSSADNFAILDTLDSYKVSGVFYFMFPGMSGSRLSNC